MAGKTIQKLPIYFHPSQLDFHPKYEWALGNRIKHPESTHRANSIVKALKKAPEIFELIAPPRIPLSAIRELHNYQLITLYNTAHALPEGKEFYPSVFLQSKKVDPDPTNINHAGHYCFDSGTPLNKNTWNAASWSAASAIEAAKAVLSQKTPVAYSLSRPPGHHATRDKYGGYCYFNNAALAARVFRKKGRVVILDIDFHHGNGTQDIFYNDDKVFTISIHGDPRKFFPYFVGFGNECGAGKGLGFNQNIIIPTSTNYSQYSKVLKEQVFPIIKRFEPSYLVIAAGFDTYEKDPVGGMNIATTDYHKIGKLLSSLQLPTAIIQEGGYYTKDLGDNVSSFLHGFANKRLN